MSGLVGGSCWALLVYLPLPLPLCELEGNGEAGGVGCGCGIEGPVLLRKRAKALRKPSVLSLSGPFPNEMHPQSTLSRAPCKAAAIALTLKSLYLISDINQ